MGVCMRDHSAEDIREKIEELQEQLDLSLAEALEGGLAQNKWEQVKLNELFHLLKKLEKNITLEEKQEIKNIIGQYLI
jgi:CCR4-NOT transcriptional regulation complex NOT5 subunit